MHHHGGPYGGRHVFALADGGGADRVGLWFDRDRDFPPEVSGSHTLYALAGMGGAVAAAVLGAPISTTLIVFEMTGDWQTGLAVMVAVSMSTTLASQLVDGSFFLMQLERRRVHLAAGPQSYLLAMFRVTSLMKPVDDAGIPDESALWEMVQAGNYVEANATLADAMPKFDRTGAPFLPVLNITGEDTPPELWGGVGACRCSGGL